MHVRRTAQSHADLEVDESSGPEGIVEALLNYLKVDAGVALSGTSGGFLLRFFVQPLLFCFEHLINFIDELQQSVEVLLIRGLLGKLHPACFGFSLHSPPRLRILLSTRLLSL